MIKLLLLFFAPPKMPTLPMLRTTADLCANCLMILSLTYTLTQTQELSEAAHTRSNEITAWPVWFFTLTQFPVPVDKRL